MKKSTKNFVIFLLMMFAFTACKSSKSFSAGQMAYNAQDYQKAKTMFEKACQEQDAQGCYQLALLYDEGRGVEQDYQKSSLLYEKACEYGNSSSCTIVGVMSFDGSYGFRKDSKKAEMFLRKACEMDDKSGCIRWKNLIRRGCLYPPCKKK